MCGEVLFAAKASDAVTMNFHYALCFMPALRCPPWLVRFLLVVLRLHISLQLIMGRIIGRTIGLPHDVVDARASLLLGNFQKILISVTIWLPYLIMPERVNLT